MSDMTAFNLNIPIPVKTIVLGAVVLCKCMNEDGDIFYTEGTDGGLSPIEILGMSVTFQDSLRRRISNASR